MAAALRRCPSGAAPSAPQTGQAVFMPPSVQGAVQVQTASSGPVSPKASASAASALIGSSDRHRARASKVANMRRLLRVIGFSFLAQAEYLFRWKLQRKRGICLFGCMVMVSLPSSVLEFFGSCKVCFPLPGENGGMEGQKVAQKCPGRLNATRGWGSYTVGSSMGAKPPLGITKISCRPGASSLKRAKPPRTRKLRMSSSASV